MVGGVEEFGAQQLRESFQECPAVTRRAGQADSLLTLDVLKVNTCREFDESKVLALARAHARNGNQSLNRLFSGVPNRLAYTRLK